MNGIILNFMHSLGYVGIVAMCLFATKYISDVMASRAGFDADWLIEEENNNGVAFRRGGIYLGTSIGMIGALLGSSKGFVNDMLWLSIDGLLIIGFMLITRMVNDKFIISGIDNDKAVKDGNTAVGIAEGANYVATGVIACASLMGTGPWYSTIVYFLLGQITLVAMVTFYELITPYDVVDDINAGNVAAGTMLGGMLIAFSLVLRGAIAGPFTSWGADLLSFGMSTLAGLVMIILVFNKLIDKCFLSGTDIRTEIERDQNVAAIIVVASVKVALALTISVVVI